MAEASHGEPECGPRGPSHRRAESNESVAQKQTIKKLEGQLQKKDSIIAFVSEEHLALKKKLGES